MLVQARVCCATGYQVGMAGAAEAALQRLLPDDPAAQALLSAYLAAGTFHGPTAARTRGSLIRLCERARDGRLPEHPGLVAHIALREAFDGAAGGRVRALSERALADDPLVDPLTHGLPFSLVVQALCMADELVFAEETAERAVAAAQERGAVVAYAVATYHRVIPRLHRGALADAASDVEQSMLVREQETSGARGFLAKLLALVHLARGDPPAAGRALALANGVPPNSLDFAMAQYARACWRSRRTSRRSPRKPPSTPGGGWPTTSTSTIRVSSDGAASPPARYTSWASRKRRSGWPRKRWNEPCGARPRWRLPGRCGPSASSSGGGGSTGSPRRSALLPTVRLCCTGPRRWST